MLVKMKVKDPTKIELVLSYTRQTRQVRHVDCGPSTNKTPPIGNFNTSGNIAISMKKKIGSHYSSGGT